MWKVIDGECGLYPQMRERRREVINHMLEIEPLFIIIGNIQINKGGGEVVQELGEADGKMGE